MTKKEFIDKLASEAGLTLKQADAAFNAVFNTITDVLLQGEDVSIPGFGNFATKDRAARAGRNPSTGEPIQIEATRLPTFKASSALKSKIKSTLKETA